MEFMQLVNNPGNGIPSSDSYCFGKKYKINPFNDLAYLYRFRDHQQSNGNNGGWDISKSSKTSFKLILTF